jgi:hypothetical protein
MTLNHKNAQCYFKLCLLIIYNVIITFSNLYSRDNFERLTQVYKNNISFYSNFLASFQLIKSSKHTKIFLMISSVSLFYNYCVFETFTYECRTNMNTNTLKTIFFSVSLFKFFYHSLPHFMTLNH